jgi:D-amino-acid dehydrogenase
MSTRTAYQRPERVLIVGAGIVGLSCAWSLQERGIEVCVVDRSEPGAGASWQNAGYVSPALSAPLPEPAILRYGVRAVLSPRSPVQLLWQNDPGLIGFMAGLARHCTATHWRRGMAAYRPLNQQVAESYERQRAGGVDSEVFTGDVLTCFGHGDGSGAFVHEIQGIIESGQRVKIELLTGDEAREREPHLSKKVALGVIIKGQQYLTPSHYVVALARSVRHRGGKILDKTPVTAVERRRGTLVAHGPDVDLEAEAVVLANGAWMSSLAADHGVRTRVYGGLGYSFTLPCSEAFKLPTYFPSARVAVTPQGGRARLAGIMEFGSPDATPRWGRIETMVHSVRPFLQDVDWDARSDDWMGPRPLTTDGLPLVGATRTPGLFVAGGHGMWGVTLGPLTGALLAERIATGISPPELRPLDPCR